MEVIVLHNQSLADIAVTYCGNYDAIYEVAYLNSLSITDELIPGQKIQVPPAYDENIVNYFKANKNQPATRERKDRSADNINYVLPGIMPYL